MAELKAELLPSEATMLPPHQPSGRGGIGFLRKVHALARSRRVWVMGLGALTGSLVAVAMTVVSREQWHAALPWTLMGLSALVGLGVWRRLRTWRRSLGKLDQVLVDVRAGEAPIDELAGVRGPLSPLAESIQEILRELRQQKAELAAVEQEIRQRIAQRTHALERVIGSLRHQANRDALTGLYNRRMLNEHLREVVEQAKEAGSDLCLMMLDLDNFKTLNDTRGHAAGDEVLRTIGQIIRSSIREQDLAFRCGGDEFTLVLPDCGAEAGQALARRLVSLIDALGRTLKTPKPLGVSIGLINLSEASDEDLQALLAEADKRLYGVKAGRKRMARAAAA
ncbi:MAG TPA: GGDEF domain-containing protein [Tepidisphaeraceae bacterium]|nr:GGDEF domain-containing protein [Tepidisphaeraceae bacterium]